MNLFKGIDEIHKRVTRLLKKQKVVIIGIAGGSGSGKGFVAKKLGYKILHEDDYYYGKDIITDHNYDVPASVDLKVLKQHINLLKKGKFVKKPIYNFATQKRKGYEKFTSDNVIIVEGLFILMKRILPIIDIPVFITAKMPTRLKRRIKRDMEEGREKQWKKILDMFFKYQEPMFKRYVLPTKKYAKVVIDNNKDI